MYRFIRMRELVPTPLNQNKLLKFKKKRFSYGKPKYLTIKR